VNLSKEKILGLNSIHYPHRVHIDVHSLYSIQENYETFKILKEKFEMELPFILTRSSYAGNGKYAAHWTGDNLANWDFLKISVPSLLNLNVSIENFSLTYSQRCLGYQ